MNKNLVLIGYTGNGFPVFDRADSHLHESMKDLIVEALRKTTPTPGFGVYGVNMGRIIGESACVETTRKDEIIYAVRPRRNGATRFVKGRKPEKTEFVTVILLKDQYEDYYVLITAFVGAPAAREPWDPNATAEDREFWKHHALVWGMEPVMPGTVTEKCPW